MPESALSLLAGSQALFLIVMARRLPRPFGILRKRGGEVSGEYWKSIIRTAFLLVGLSPVVMVIYFALFRTLTKEYLLLILGASWAVLLFIFGSLCFTRWPRIKSASDKLVNEQNGDASIAVSNS